MKKTTRRPVRRLTESQLRRIIRQEVRRSQALRENLGMVGVLEAEEAQSEVTAMARDYINGVSSTIDIQRLEGLLGDIRDAGGAVDAEALVPRDRAVVARSEFVTAIKDWLYDNGLLGL